VSYSQNCRANFETVANSLAQKPSENDETIRNTIGDFRGLSALQ